MGDYAIAVQNISYSYPDGNEAVKNISFSVAPGESIGVIGANGAGKSTLLLLLMGILTPAGGDILIDSTKMSKQTLPTLRKKLGLVFQNPDDQLFMNTIYDDVAFGPQNMGLAPEDVDRRVKAALNAVHIPHLAGRAPYKCSGGEKRAAAIASVLAMQPDILILDEPTSDLDPRARRTAIALLKGLAYTKIVASHDIDMVLELCERVIILQNGRVCADGETHAVVTDVDLMRRYGLEPPLCMGAGSSG